VVAVGNPRGGFLRVRGLRVIGIDEVSYHKRHKYATLVYILERSVVVWVSQARGRATIDQFFEHRPARADGWPGS
jgi:transposase